MLSLTAIFPGLSSMFERIGLIAKSGAVEIRDTLSYLVQYLQDRQRHRSLSMNAAPRYSAVTIYR
ncbi:MAG: hypothetical protein U5P41_06160 [Gammaproteobacteria bacterium]|nr:hypothetical protein [Gammaproteobacteria bacterium]